MSEKTQTISEEKKPDIKGMVEELVTKSDPDLIKIWRVAIQGDTDTEPEPEVLGLIVATEDNMITMFRFIREEVEVDINDRRIILRPR